MNIALEQTEEYANGQLKNKYGDAFIRGNNGQLHLLLCFVLFATYYQLIDIFFFLVLYISTQKRR
jgi:hypothetical protein